MAHGPYVYDPEKKTFVVRTDSHCWPNMPCDPVITAVGDNPAYARKRVWIRSILVFWGVIAIVLVFLSIFVDVLHKADGEIRAVPKLRLLK